MVFGRKKDTPTDRTREMLQRYFNELGIYIKVSVNDREEPGVSLVIHPSGWDSLGSNLADFWLADGMAERTQRVGFILGQMSASRLKPKAMVVGPYGIEAPTGEELEKFVHKWVNEQSQAASR